MSIATFTDVAAACVVTYSLPYLLGTPGYSGVNLGANVGYIFAGIAFLSFVFVTLFVPELAGRSLEEVDELFVSCNAMRHRAQLTLRAHGYGRGNSRGIRLLAWAHRSPVSKGATRCQGTWQKEPLRKCLRSMALDRTWTRKIWESLWSKLEGSKARSG